MEKVIKNDRKSVMASIGIITGIILFLLAKFGAHADITQSLDFLLVDL